MDTKATQLTTQQLLDQAVALQAAGAIGPAREIFLQVLEGDPSNAVAHYSVGALDASTGATASAMEHFQRVIAAFPKFAPAHLALSVVLFNQGQLDEALASAERALALEPDLGSAAEHIEAVKLGLQARQQAAAGGNHEQPQASEASRLVGEGVNLQVKGRHEEALALFRQGLAVEPNYFPALYSMGLSLSRSGQPHAAVDYFNRAVAVQPEAAIAHYALGKGLQDLGLAEEALVAFDRAIEIDPQYMEAHHNKAALLQSINRHHDALMTLAKASEFNPHHVRTLEGQGLLLTQFKQYQWATNAFAHALTVDPDHPYLQGNLMSARLHNCDWTDFDAARDKIFDGIRAGQRVCSPHTIMSLTDDAQLARQCIEIYAADKFGPSMYTLWRGEAYRHRRKRVAFISGDFRTHPVGYLLIGMIENIDKRRFETIGVSTGAPDGSELWRRYRCGFEHYLDVQSKPSLEIAQMLRALEVDIAIDLSGYTEGSRLDVLAHRPAPVQMTYLGFPGTLGLPFIDCLIADKRTIPVEHQKHYKEKILYLPHCYLPRDTGVVPSPDCPGRAHFGLPEKGIVFCSFNHDYKINPHVFRVWMDLLKSVPGSVLWLMKLNEGAHINLTRSATAHGVDPARIVYATRLPKIEDHLARYRLADVFLDTYPYNGHTTAGDALRAGLPVVSLVGESFASRVAASLLSDVGLPSYGCTTLEGYAQTALRLATNQEERRAVAEQLDSRISQAQWPPSDLAQAQALMGVLHDAQGSQP